jgi:hypothetical protein
MHLFFPTTLYSEGAPFFCISCHQIIMNLFRVHWWTSDIKWVFACCAPDVVELQFFTHVLFSLLFCICAREYHLGAIAFIKRLFVLMDKLIIDSTEAKRATLIKTYWRVPRFVRVKIEIVIAECISISMDTNRIPFKRA